MEVITHVCSYYHTLLSHDTATCRQVQVIISYINKHIDDMSIDG